MDYTRREFGKMALAATSLPIPARLPIPAARVITGGSPVRSARCDGSRDGRCDHG